MRQHRARKTSWVANARVVMSLWCSSRKCVRVRHAAVVMMFWFCARIVDRLMMRTERRANARSTKLWQSNWKHTYWYVMRAKLVMVLIVMMWTPKVLKTPQLCYVGCARHKKYQYVQTRLVSCAHCRRMCVRTARG